MKKEDFLKYENHILNHGLGINFRYSYLYFVGNSYVLFTSEKKMTTRKEQEITKVSEIKEEVKRVPKTLSQTLLPGVILLIMGTIITLSLKYVQPCETNCLLSGGGIGTVGLIALYIIGKAIKDYLV